MARLHQTLRRLFRSLGFTLTTVLTLAIGIGATIAIFSVVNGILLKPLPFPDSDRLIALVHQAPGVGATALAASPAFYLTYKEHNTTFESLALWADNTASVTGAGDPEEVPRLMATYDLLATLRVQPIVGRDFTEAEGQSGGPQAVILSYAYWQRRFGGAAVLGQSLVVDGAPREIVGVLPRDFRFTQRPVDVITPDILVGGLPFVPSTGERGIARLKEGVTLEQAAADVARMIPIYLDSYPIVPGLTRAAVDSMQLGPNLRTLKSYIVRDLDDVLWMLMGAVGILLLIACANVANLQLVRTEVRRQELAIRAALGAAKARIAGSLLGESVLLGLMGGVLGLALATATLPLLLAVAGENLPTALAITIDPTVLAFAPAVSLLSGLLLGVIPTLKYMGGQFVARLSSTGRMSVGRERHRARNTLVVVQVALALVLLVGSGLMIRTFLSLRDVDPGFTGPHQVQTFKVSIPQPAVPDFSDAIRMQNDIVAALGAVAGVESVGFATRLPLGGARGPTGPFLLEGRPDGASLEVWFRYASPRYFETLGTPLVAGRDLTWADHAGTQLRAVVSRTMAEREWGSAQAAIGKRLRRSVDSPWIEVIGVAGDIRLSGVDQAAPYAVYLSSNEFVAQFAARLVYFVVRSERTGSPAFMRELERAVWSVNGNLPLGEMQTIGDLYDGSMARTSLTLVLISVAGAMALTLGLVGIYGVLSYVLTQRTREIGIRIALGAQHAHVERMLFGHALALVGVGVVLGLGGAALLTRLMESLLFGVTTLDPPTYVVGAATLIAMGALAGYLPARRATRVDPLSALRAE